MKTFQLCCITTMLFLLGSLGTPKYAFAQRTCVSCYGSGQVSSSCTSCRGKGYIMNFDLSTSTCLACSGNGNTKSACNRCGGSGKVQPSPPDDHSEKYPDPLQGGIWTDHEGNRWKFKRFYGEVKDFDGKIYTVELIGAYKGMAAVKSNKMIMSIEMLGNKAEYHLSLSNNLLSGYYEIWGIKQPCTFTRR